MACGDSGKLAHAGKALGAIHLARSSQPWFVAPIVTRAATPQRGDHEKSPYKWHLLVP